MRFIAARCNNMNANLLLDTERILGGHLQTGHRGSLKNRPTGLAEVLMVFPSLGRFERRHLLADDFVFVPCYLWWGSMARDIWM